MPGQGRHAPGARGNARSCQSAVGKTSVVNSLSSRYGLFSTYLAAALSQGPVVDGGGLMRVALIHYWLVSMRGGEKVLEALLELFPEADVFTHVYAPENVSPAIRQRRVNTTFIQKLPFAAAHYPKYLPLMPLALEQLDLRGYDLVISSESGPAKGVLTGPDTLHLCYCHSPMRYLWDFYQDYLQQIGPVPRLLFRLLSGRLRAWDALSSMRVDHFAANSRNVARRIAKHYRRNAEVIHPPVDVRAFAPQDGRYPRPEEYYLYAGQLTAYKRADLAVQACARMGRKLVIIGEGPEYKNLARLAGPTVSFLGRQDGPALARHLQRCRALLFPGEEDFGLIPVEALAAGRPVIAYGRGGVLETVRHGRSGIFFPSQDVVSLCRAMEDLESGKYQFDPGALAREAERFSPAIFKEAFSDFLTRCLESRGKSREAAPVPEQENGS